MLAKKLLHRVQMYLLLRRANKLIRVKRNKDGMKILDWAPQKSQKGILILCAASLLIVCNFIFFIDENLNAITEPVHNKTNLISCSDATVISKSAVIHQQNGENNE